MISFKKKAPVAGDTIVESVENYSVMEQYIVGLRYRRMNERKSYYINIDSMGEVEIDEKTYNEVKEQLQSLQYTFMED